MRRSGLALRARSSLETITPVAGCDLVRLRRFSVSRSRPVPALNEVAHKWRELAERRRAYLVDLYYSGRWKRYCSEEQLLRRIRDAVDASERWGEIAPPPDVAPPEPASSVPDRSAA